MAAIFQDGWHLNGAVSDIMVYLVVQAWKLAWAVSVGHLTRKLSEPFEISRWRPFFKMTAVRWCGSLNDTFFHRNVLGSSKGSVKRGCLTAICLTPRPRPVQFGKTCQELPPTGIALRVHWGTQAPLPRHGYSHKRVFIFLFYFFNVFYVKAYMWKHWWQRVLAGATT